MGSVSNRTCAAIFFKCFHNCFHIESYNKAYLTLRFVIPSTLLPTWRSYADAWELWREDGFAALWRDLASQNTFCMLKSCSV